MIKIGAVFVHFDQTPPVCILNYLAIAISVNPFRTLLIIQLCAK